MPVLLSHPHLTRHNDLVAQCRPPEPLPGGGQRPAGDGDPGGRPLPQQLRAGQVGGAVPGTDRIDTRSFEILTPFQCINV